MKKPEVPTFLRETHELRTPSRIFVTGDIGSASDVYNVHQELRELFTFSDTSSVAMTNEMLVMTLPYGRGKSRIRRDHPRQLVEGRGLGGDTTDAMFVGSRVRRVSREGLIWIGRALGSEQIQNIFYLDLGRVGLGGLGLDVPTGFDGLKIINNLNGIFSYVNKVTGDETPYDSVQLQTPGAEVRK